MEHVKLKVQNITKVFGKNPSKAIDLLQKGKTKKEILEETGMTIGVNQANFEIKSGEIFVIMGLSGSGKSTLVRMFNRLVEPTSGSLILDGDDVVKMNKEELRDMRRKKMSMVFQNFALFPHRTVLDNTEYGLEVQGTPKAEREKKAKEALELVGLKGYENQYPGELSGGMQQRVGLARALANDPDILLMDEAFSALDPLIRKDMQDFLLELQEKMERTIIFITHDLDEALRIGDRIVLMKDGSVVQVGTPEEIMTNPANDYVERFVEDVNVAKVYTAESVMNRAESITVDRGPRVALKIMQEAGYSSIYVVDKKKTLLGVVTADDIIRAIKQDKLTADVLDTDIPTVTTDTLLENLYDKMVISRFPLPVVDENHRLRGIIKKERVIEALAGTDSNEVNVNE
ncbi:glycine betaine/L-proline ABC transporter ATP-binding protein [Priestia megaterium]|jgi:glycine betaine/proline transport system ATP-binding protein|uniref:Quaternary amine transport ATP-binding protein n=1 Tax=Priestia megaterium (strain ATCC 14581 / DSM 32 / CCUG 1817 / JCM 2506 / NBRC 15308 / NCIMB 9376 / NCTC 10342 / NRRL B-14308 / VKM B-512 / Ford 19) TaxID=1348623 RepID=A0A0B6AX92_PRIM2|nr:MULTISPECIES: glycine betaine/L-proline ABC transporter ATP-binding protein [Priestia]AJI24499.1 glycine betaine/L-proline transport ATP binding subunit [Priestia megaterium NBRC 15308 = ATCC 14581]KFM98264.1 glycine betaine/L-proline transport ATP binding subunit [Priestia megaterium]KGJ76221.1 glycine/betaine ABC transporter ATP-binding protein [Priestia megaterium NBRC 15308 = ATCC 14581]MBU8752081.1 glycine betaine/L-proline ABC transporter ATP-binding protein [Priestia megaterium]MCU77